MVEGHSHLPKPAGPHNRAYGLYKGQIVDVIYSDNTTDDNTTKDTIEYIVNINGQDYNGVRDIRVVGGIYNYSEIIRKKTEISTTIPSGQVPDEKLDGETVLVAFIEGHCDYPVIVGGFPHPKHSEYKKSVTDDGQYYRQEYNGIEWIIDKDGTLTFEQIGIKDSKNPDIEAAKSIFSNQIAVGAKITLNGVTGDIIINSPNGNFIEIKNDAINMNIIGNAETTATKVAFGNGTIEVLDLVDQLLDSILIHTHIGFAAIATIPPDVGTITTITQIKTLLGIIKI